MRQVAFSICSRNPAASSDKLFVGIEHWDSGIHYVKSSVMPPVNRTHKAAPDYEHNGAIFWKDVPHRPSRSFKASFFSDKKGVVEFHPGACLQNGTTKYCCKYETIRVSGLVNMRGKKLWDFTLFLARKAADKKLYLTGECG